MRFDLFNKQTWGCSQPWKKMNNMAMETATDAKRTDSCRGEGQVRKGKSLSVNETMMLFFFFQASSPKMAQTTFNLLLTLIQTKDGTKLLGMRWHLRLA